MYFEICALLVPSYADLEESTFEVDYDVHSIVLTVSVSSCAHKAVLWPALLVADTVMAVG